MHLIRSARRPVAAAVIPATLVAALLAASPVAAHEHRHVGDYSITVGFMDEPVYVGQKSGLEFSVEKDETPVEGLEETLEAQVLFGDQARDLPVSRTFGEPGAYDSVFFPTAAGAYSFRIFGTIEGTAVDETFTSGPETFSDVNELASGQFPVQFPAQGDLVADVQAARDATSQVPLALGLGVVALVVSLVAAGLSLTGRRRTA